MAHPNNKARHQRRHGHAVKTGKTLEGASAQEARPRLEVLLKSNSEGGLEAAAAAISEIALPEVDLLVMRKGIGSVTASDVFLAETASRLIIGFQVDVLSGVDKALREHDVEVRLYDVIYRLTEDLKTVAESIAPHFSEEVVTGSARIIALFKSSRRGIIVGCEVSEGRLAIGQHFRIISAMGPVYSGTIESLHMGDHAVQTASSGQQVGLRIKNFNRVKIGDIVESYRRHKETRGWKPTGGIIRR